MKWRKVFATIGLVSVAVVVLAVVYDWLSTPRFSASGTIGGGHEDDDEFDEFLDFDIWNED